VVVVVLVEMKMESINENLQTMRTKGVDEANVKVKRNREMRVRRRGGVKIKLKMIHVKECGN
jgi:hypothetical protein